MSAVADQAIVAAIVREPKARPMASKMTFRRISRILRAIQGGTPVKYAIAQGGIGERTWYDWVEQKPQLAALADRARRRSVAGLVSKVADGRMINGKPDWKASSWILERIAKDEFAGPKQTETTVNVQNNSLTVNVSSESTKALAQAHAEAMAKLALQAPVVVASLNNATPGTTSEGSGTAK